MAKSKFLALTIGIFLFGFQASAQQYKHEVGFQSDNDSYLAQGSDRYYTNGLFLNYRFATDQERLKSGLQKKVIELSAGQMIFNPRSGYRPDPATQDRPFAGYLYLGGAISWFHSDEHMLKAAVQIGTTGPNSLAQDGQELLHRTIGFYDLEGWDYQIKNEAAVNASVQYVRLLQRAENTKTDFSFEGYANAGTTFSGAGAAVLFRAGNIEQLFNSASYDARVGTAGSVANGQRHELFFYAKPQLNFVAYDATVQGSMFSNNSPVTYGIKPLVFAQQFGVNYSTGRLSLDFNVIFETREIKSSATAHQFGSISASYRFN
jgi:lipid A 3-O-deacylase